jgi:hypothetical protein
MLGKLERFARAIVDHTAVCGGALLPTERPILSLQFPTAQTVRPLQDTTIALTCQTCGQMFREHFTPAELASDGDTLKLVFAAFQRRSTN